MMKNWLIYKLIAPVAAVFLLTGCIIVINQATPEEKELMAIQQTVGAEMTEVGAKVTSDQYSQAQKEDFIAQAESTVSQALQRIQELDIPAKTKRFSEQTVTYLMAAKNIFLKMKDFVTTVNLEELKEIGEEKLREAEATFNDYAVQLKRLVNNLDSIRAQIETMSSK